MLRGPGSPAQRVRLRAELGYPELVEIVQGTWLAQAAARRAAARQAGEASR